MQTTANRSDHWADELHDPILTDGCGPLAAFDQLPAPRAPRPSLFRRLDMALRRRYLRWLQRDLRGQLAHTQAQLDAATHQVIQLSRQHRCSPKLQTLRQGLRADRDTLEQRLKTVGVQLVKLEQGK